MTKNEAIEGLQETESRLMELKKERDQLQGDVDICRRRIADLSGDVTVSVEQIEEVTAMETERIEKLSKRVEGVTDRIQTLGNRADEYRGIIMRHEKRADEETYNELTMEAYREMKKYNRSVEEVNDLASKIAALLMARPKVLTDIRKADGGLQRAVHLLPNPCTNENVFQNQIELLTICDERWFIDYQKGVMK